MLRIVAFVFLSALTTLSDLHGQERFKDFEEEYSHRATNYTVPKPEYPHGAQGDAHEGDSLALVAFYHATRGPSNRGTWSGWLQEPVSAWRGIKLDTTGRVTAINLEHNDLQGSLPSELWQLTKLEILDIGSWIGWPTNGSNRLQGELSPDMRHLSELRYLDLGGNNLSGSIPAELGNLTKLEVVSLTANGFYGPFPPDLHQLTELTHLHLSENDLSGPIPPELGQLSELKELLLAYNELSGPIPAELGNLAKLEKLDLHRNLLDGRIPPELGRLSELLELWLSSNDLSGPIPPELGDLGRLEWLSLFRNSLSGPIPLELADLTELLRLWVSENNLSGSIPPELGRLEKLWDLVLSNNDFSGPIPPELGRLEKLQDLLLFRNNLSGPIPSQLKQLDSLQWVFLHDNQLSGPVPDWTELSELSVLILSDNQFLFADLLPNAALSRLFHFEYAPQDSIDTQLSCNSSEFIFTTPAPAQGNHYQWYLNDQAMPGERAVSLRLTSASEGDYYHATITNSALPDLTLVSRKVGIGGASDCTTQQHANVADSTLLVDFFNRTQGSLVWHNHTGWLVEPVAEWYGITLDAAGRVTDINLPSNNLVGQLPLSQLDQLPHLRYLDVSGNEFSGTIPKGLGALTQLEYLDLSRNTLAGELPKELAGQAPLKMLNVTGNQLVGTIPTELSQIATLQTFSVSTNQLSGPVPAFTGLDQLDTLHLAQNAFLFMDLLPNASLTRLDDFVYAPQDFIETLLTSTASGFALTTAAKAVGNRYQWYRDDQPISGPQSDTLQVSATSDPAQYYATITNDRLPDLTLVSRKKGVHDGLTLTEGELPDNFLLHQSYPNPFAEATTVAFELGTPEHVRIVVYDLLGKAVATIADGRFTAGVHRVEFTGDQLASGQYMYRMEAGAYQATRFMSLVR